MKGRMTKDGKGLLSKLMDKISTSPSEAKKRAHEELVRAAYTQAAKTIMLGMTNTLSERRNSREQREAAWWKAQTAKWETLWRMFTEAFKTPRDIGQLTDLRRVSEAAFALYEQMSIEAVISMTDVSGTTLRNEARRWREVGTLIASLHRHCLMNALTTTQTVKITPLSGITVTKER